MDFPPLRGTFSYNITTNITVGKKHLFHTKIIQILTLSQKLNKKKIRK